MFVGSLHSEYQMWFYVILNQVGVVTGKVDLGQII
jgi:hypothetical protein